MGFLMPKDKNMKPTKRYEFKFQRSYFDVMNKLKDPNDRLQFLEAIINKSFLDEDPDDISLIADLAYESQRHFIEKSVKGYKDRMKTDLLGNPIKGVKDTHPEGVMEGVVEDLPDKNKNKNKRKSNDDVIVSIDKCLEMYLKEPKIIDAISKSQQRSTDEILKNLYLFADHLKSTTQVKGYSDFKTHFLAWLKKQPRDKKQKTTLADVQRIWKPMI